MLAFMKGAVICMVLSPPIKNKCITKERVSIHYVDIK